MTLEMSSRVAWESGLPPELSFVLRTCREAEDDDDEASARGAECLLRGPRGTSEDEDEEWESGLPPRFALHGLDKGG